MTNSHEPLDRLLSFGPIIIGVKGRKVVAKSNGDATGIDKDALYGKYQSGLDWRENLAKQTAHKAVDIPVSDMPIDSRKSKVIDKSQHGLGPIAAVLLALAAGLPSAIFGIALLSKLNPAKTESPAVPPKDVPKGVAKEILKDTDTDTTTILKPIKGE